MAINDDLFKILSRTPGFRGPVDFTNDIKKKTDEGFFRPKDHPFQFKFLDDQNVGFRKVSNKETGMVSLSKMLEDFPNFATDSTVQAHAPQTIKEALLRMGGGSGTSTRTDAPPTQGSPSILATNGTPQDNLMRALTAGVQAQNNLQAPQTLKDGAPVAKPAPTRRKGMGEFEDVMARPDVQQALAAFGAAIGGGEATAGGRMGTAAKGLIDNAAQSRYLQGLLSGKSIAEMERDLSGISDVGRNSAIEKAGMSPEQRLAARAADREDRKVDQGDVGLGFEGQLTESSVAKTKADIKNDATKIEQNAEGLGLERRKVDLAEDSNTYNIQRQTALDSIAERQRIRENESADITDAVNEARATVLDAQAGTYDNQKTASIINTALITSNKLISSIGEQQTDLRYLEDDVNLHNRALTDKKLRDQLKKSIPEIEEYLKSAPAAVTKAQELLETSKANLAQNQETLSTIGNTPDMNNVNDKGEVIVANDAMAERLPPGTYFFNKETGLRGKTEAIEEN